MLNFLTPDFSVFLNSNDKYFKVNSQRNGILNYGNTMPSNRNSKNWNAEGVTKHCDWPWQGVSEKCIFLWTALDALFFSCWEFTRAYVLFWLHLISESIYSTRIRILLSSYRSSKYFLAVDFIILREPFPINFCLCFLLPQGRRQPHPQDICFTLWMTRSLE